MTTVTSSGDAQDSFSNPFNHRKILSALCRSSSGCAPARPWPHPFLLLLLLLQVLCLGELLPCSSTILCAVNVAYTLIKKGSSSRFHIKQIKADVAFFSKDKMYKSRYAGLSDDIFGRSLHCQRFVTVRARRFPARGSPGEKKKPEEGHPAEQT